MPSIYIYIYIQFSGIQSIYAQLTEEFTSRSVCSGIQGIYDWLPRVGSSPCYIYICSVVIYKVSMLNSQGGLISFYIQVGPA